MEPVTVLDAPGGPWTRAMRDALPDDGRRHEILDGTLIVTPAPGVGHQHGLRNLFRTLDAACPDGVEVYFAPLDVALSDITVLEPDLLVARTERFTERDLPEPPLLAVEVLSPSTRLYDLNLKRAKFEEAACASYWVLDPATRTLVAWELVEGAYAEVARLDGDDAWTAAQPFEVRLCPAELLG